MLTQIVRPMVRTQIRLLAGSHATRPVLVKTIAQWLGFLGVEAKVTQLAANAHQIQVSLTVGKPDACDGNDWEKILQHLRCDASEKSDLQAIAGFTAKQQSQLQRLLAYVIQVGNPEESLDWSAIEPQLQTMGFEASLIAGIGAALKVPQSLDLLMETLEDDVAAVALPKAVSIALLDRKVTPSEDRALSALIAAL
ncbi:hypothetical protein [Almyronema epifaneia]|uniref:Uncharacterized protein n=1 Tax=Almyronema epifaneia S1 TaxID=2991925 RepID=A0ABW6ID28_9CYAN